MLNSRKLIVDNFCEVADLIKDITDETFWDLTQHEVVPGAIYIIGRQQFTDNSNLIKQLADQTITVLSNPAEGSETLYRQIERLGLMDYVLNKKILLLTGGFLPDTVPALYYENYLPKLLDYAENIQAADEYCANWTNTRPYKFLFLNGRNRPHRKSLLERLNPILDQAIWTNLDSGAGPVKLLDPCYEFDFYQEQKDIPDTGFIKYKLFKGDWGDIYLKSTPYTDSYFSLVTETIFEYPYSFRTEKIWKPICIGHPWIAVSNAGYYRDMRAIGFRTFNNLIDESFDNIEDNDKRLERIALEVEWLCQQDLAKFAEAAWDICKYNQQHLAEMRIQVRKEFPDRFTQFIQKYS